MTNGRAGYTLAAGYNGDAMLTYEQTHYTHNENTLDQDRGQNKNGRQSGYKNMNKCARKARRVQECNTAGTPAGNSLDGTFTGNEEQRTFPTLVQENTMANNGTTSIHVSSNGIKKSGREEISDILKLAPESNEAITTPDNITEPLSREHPMTIREKRTQREFCARKQKKKLGKKQAKHEHKTQNNVRDIREPLDTAQMGVTKLLTEAEQEASPAATKKRAIREDDSPQSGTVPSGERGKDKMDTDQGMGGSPVMIHHFDTTGQTPRHDE